MLEVVLGTDIFKISRFVFFRKTDIFGSVGSVCRFFRIFKKSNGYAQFRDLPQFAAIFLTFQVNLIQGDAAISKSKVEGACIQYDFVVFFFALGFGSVLPKNRCRFQVLV